MSLKGLIKAHSQNGLFSNPIRSMATWTQYIEFIQSKGNIQDVMIISTETGGLWAGTTDFVLREYKATIVQEVRPGSLLRTPVFIVSRTDQKWKS